MILAAEVIPGQTSSEPLGLLLAAIAVAVSIVAAGLAWKQGRAIQRIETAEHEWQKVDRVSAWVEVVHHHVETSHVVGARVERKYQDWLRLRNTGRAPAVDVKWGGEYEGAMFYPIRSLEILHPGEHFDVHFALSLSERSDWVFWVEWTDERGTYRTERRVN